jgi:hypothetical protein
MRKALSLMALIGSLICGCAARQTPPCSFYNQIKSYASNRKGGVSEIEASFDEVPVKIYLYDSHSQHSLRIIGEVSIGDFIDIRPMERDKIYWRCKEKNTFLYVSDMNADGNINEDESSLYSVADAPEFFDYIVKTLADSEIISDRLPNEKYWELQKKILGSLNKNRRPSERLDESEFYYLSKSKY